MQTELSKLIIGGSGELGSLSSAVNVAASVELECAIRLVQAELSQSAGRELARRAVKRILSGYPPPDVLDPKLAFERMIEAIEDYPSCIIDELQCAKRGIIRTCKFAPRISELVKWCDAKLWSYFVAIGQAENVLRAREKADRARVMAAEAEAREKEAQQTEAILTEELRGIRLPEDHLPAFGEAQAFERWKAAMAKTLSYRPDLITDYIIMLRDNRGLCLMATKQENMYRNSGWPLLGRHLFELYTAQKATGKRGS